MNTTQQPPLRLPPRRGDRPRTTTDFPHSQLDQQPEDGRYAESVLATALTWPAVREQRSGISVEGARALTLDPSAAAGPPEAFLTDREFCHVHASGDLSLHAMLPPALAADAEAAGWAEPHFLVRAGQAPPSAVLLFAPRDDHERDVIVHLVRASYEFALGPGRAAHVAADEAAATHQHSLDKQEEPCPSIS
jgi:hypothetical protein